jgi:hypothetical protein
MRLRSELLLFAAVAALWSPVLFSDVLGGNFCGTYINGVLTKPDYSTCYLDFWDFHTSTFIITDILAFAPMSALVVSVAQRVDWKTASAFTLIGFWALLLAIPDWIGGDLSPTFEHLEPSFAGASIAFMFIAALIYRQTLRRKK